MTGRSLLCSAVLFGLVIAADRPAFSQDADCRYFKVQNDNLNIAKEPRGDAALIDTLSKNDILCITRTQQVGDREWGFVANKVEGRNRRPVEGWAIMRSLQAATPGDVSAAGGSPAAAAAAASTAPPGGGLGSDYVVKFSEPIPFGPFPVNGHSLEELINGVPMFPPIEGLPDATWQKTCNSCHKWNRQSLCEQGAIYAKDPKMALRLVHPYGGPDKIAMTNWAKNGCQ